MKDNTKHFKNLIVFVIGVMLISSAAFASNKIQDISITLMLTGLKLSPNGDKIAFDFIWGRNDEGGADIGVLSLNNNEIKIITKSSEGSINEYSTWSNNGKHILFRSSKEDGVRLLLINPETLKEDVLNFFQYNENYENKKHVEISYLYPIGFPLRNKLVFIKSEFDKDNGAAILYSGYVYDLKEKKEKEIVKGMSSSVTYGHTWSVSYDGNYVFYTKENGKYNDMWTTDLRKDNNGDRRLTKGYNVTYLVASPTMNELLFVAKGMTTNSWALYKLNIESKTEEKLFEGNYINLGYPAWSQDGSLIVLVNDKDTIIIMDVTKRIITSKLKINKKPIAFPLLVKNREVIFYHKYSSIWSVDMGGKHLKEIFSNNFKRELKELKGTSFSE